MTSVFQSDDGRVTADVVRSHNWCNQENGAIRKFVQSCRDVLRSGKSCNQGQAIGAITDVVYIKQLVQSGMIAQAYRSDNWCNQGCGTDQTIGANQGSGAIMQLVQSKKSCEQEIGASVTIMHAIGAVSYVVQDKTIGAIKDAWGIDQTTAAIREVICIMQFVQSGMVCNY